MSKELSKEVTDLRKMIEYNSQIVADLKEFMPLFEKSGEARKSVSKLAHEHRRLATQILSKVKGMRPWDAKAPKPVKGAAKRKTSNQ
jgi:hypothetical protein